MKKVLVVVLLLGMLLVLSVNSVLADVVFIVNMDGAQEVPGPGDANGSGFSYVSVDRPNQTICFGMTLTMVRNPTAAHIHLGAAGVAGPVVLTITPAIWHHPWCTTAPQALIRDILNNPQNYYINVHSMQFPAGAVRGQLQ
jgi:hypothetical protein